MKRKWIQQKIQTLKTQNGTLRKPVEREDLIAQKNDDIAEKTVKF